ncbi:hypothetical protein MHU86_7473 [Fragilaria crotonensis]|nr:hypothetical protein MHU86_7473 [Fragilaria crotonensis]
MLLQIDVYPNNFSIDAASEELESPPQSLLVSLNTSSSSTILTVGRKDALVVFGADKSVSRQHLTLELVSSHDFEKVDGKPLPRAPQGTAESDACQEYDMICVLKDSSKFGTYFVTGDKTESKKQGANDSTGDDETDDEGPASSAPQGSQLSSVASKLLNPNDATSVKIEEPLILTNLCQSNGRVVIQVGQNGSTLVIHRVPIRIVLSRANKKVKDLWSSRSYVLGTTLLEIVDTSISHLVTDARITNAKSLTAWCLSKPLVTFDFLEALWNRLSPNDPLPAWVDYETPEADDGLTFWKDTPNPKLWSGTTMLSFGPRTDDMEALCRAAGATIIELDTYDDPLTAIEETVLANEGCFYVQSSSKSHAKMMKRFKSLKIPYVTQKTIALCVSQQSQLVSDSDHGVIGTQVLGIEEPTVVTTATKADQEKTPRATTSSRVMPESIEEHTLVSTAAEAHQETPSRSRSSNRLPSSAMETPPVIATATKPSHERPSRSRMSSRLAPAAPFDEPAPFDESPISVRSKRTAPRKESLVAKSKLQLTPPEEEDADDSDEDLPKTFSRSHRKSRRLIPPRERSQRLQRSQTHDESDGNDDESFQKPVSRSQEYSHPNEMEGEMSEDKLSKSQASLNTVERGESNGVESESSQASRKREFEAIGDFCGDEEFKSSKKLKKSLGGWTDVRKVNREPVDGMNVSTSSFNDDDDENPVVGDSSQPSGRTHFGVRKSLPKTNDGWLVAAPRDRTEFKATEAEILDALGDVTQLPPIAETDVVDGLVVRAKEQATRLNLKSSGLKDFRRFRKNSVMRVGRSSRIQMRIVLPKASDRQMEIQEEQAALEASLREADILFQDSTGGIRGHFKPTSRLKMRQV